MATFGEPQISIIYKNRPLVCLVPAESSSTYSVRTIFLLSHVIRALVIMFIGWQSFPSFCNRQAVHSIAVRSVGHKLRLCYQPKFYLEIWQFPVALTNSIFTRCNCTDWTYLLTKNILCGWARHEGVPLDVCDVSANVTYVRTYVRTWFMSWHYCGSAEDTT